MRFTKVPQSYTPVRARKTATETADVREADQFEGSLAAPRAGGAEALTHDGVGLEIDPTDSILFALAQAVEQRDSQTAGHCERLAFMGVALGMAMNLNRAHLLALYRGGYLHDLGKVGIADSILFKPGKLSPEEWVVMRSHPVRGEQICRALPSLRPVLPIIRHHHERWDGTGYPDGLRGKQIPLLARIVRIADIYDALINVRPYKPAISDKDALEILREETARGWNDPEVVDVFFRLHDNVIARANDYTCGPDQSLEAMRGALSNLENSL